MNDYIMCGTATYRQPSISMALSSHDLHVYMYCPSIQYEAELLVTNEVIEEHTTDLRQLYMSVVEEEEERERAVHLTHSQLVRELGKEMGTLKAEVSVSFQIMRFYERIERVCIRTATLCVVQLQLFYRYTVYFMINVFTPAHPLASSPRSKPLLVRWRPL